MINKIITLQYDLEQIISTFVKFYQGSRNPRFNHDKRIKNWQKTRNPIGEKNPLVKSYVPGYEIHGETLEFQGWNCWNLVMLLN